MLFKLVSLLVVIVLLVVVRGEEPPTETAVEKVMSAINSRLNNCTESFSGGETGCGWRPGECVTFMLSGFCHIKQEKWEMVRDSKEEFQFILFVRIPKLIVEYREKTYHAGKAKIKLYLKFIKPNVIVPEEKTCIMSAYFREEISNLPYFTLNLLDFNRSFNDRARYEVESGIIRTLDEGYRNEKYHTLFGCPDI